MKKQHGATTMLIKKLFKLDQNPFKNTSDPVFYYPTESARKAYHCITDAIYQKIPYVVLSGDPGTGKTMLLKTLMADETLPVQWMFFNHVSLDWEDILAAMGRALKIPEPKNSVENITAQIAVCLKDFSNRKILPVLIIDEAHRLASATLMSLFKWHTGLKKQGITLTVILAGQTDFTRTLIDSNMSRFTANATVHCRLKELTPSECRAMIAHRLEAAGYSGSTLFSKRALRAAIQLSGGIPRVLNNICDFGLFKATTHARKKVAFEDIRHPSQYNLQKINWLDTGKTTGILSAYRLSSLWPSTGCQRRDFLKGMVSALKGQAAAWNPLSRFKLQSRPASIFSQLKSLSLWRSLFFPWGYGVTCLLIVVGSVAIRFRDPATIAPVLTAVSHLERVNRPPEPKTALDTKIIVSEMVPRNQLQLHQRDIWQTLPSADEKAPLSKPAESPVPMELADFVDLPVILASADHTPPETDRKTAEPAETRDWPVDVPDETPEPVAKSAPGAPEKPVTSAVAFADNRSRVSAILSAKPESSEQPRESAESVSSLKSAPSLKSVPLLKSGVSTASGSSVKPPPTKKNSPPPHPPQIARRTRKEPPPVVAVSAPVVSHPAVSRPTVLPQKVSSQPQRDDTVSNGLFMAIMQGDADMVREKLTEGADPDTIFSGNKTALTLAVDRGRIEIVRALLDQGAAIDQPTPSGETALMKSAWAGHEVITDLLLNRGARVNSQNQEGWTPLFYGAVMGRIRIVKQLAAHGARLDLADRDKRSPLMAAAWNGHTKLVRYLLGQGAYPNIQDCDGWTPLMFAAFEGHADVVQVLISNGANPGLKNIRGLSGAELATNRGHADLFAMISSHTHP